MTKPETEWVSVPRDVVRRVMFVMADEARPTSADYHALKAAITAAPPAPSVPDVVPVDMLLWCPACGEQHIDDPDERTPGWVNPPHRSHLCHSCTHIWRPADVATNGVRALKTQGKSDSVPIPPILHTKLLEFHAAKEAAEAARETLEDEQAAHRDTLRQLREKCGCRFVDNAPVQRCAIHQMHHDLAGRTEAAEADKDDAYAQRNHVVAVLARLYPSGIGRTDIPGWMPEWHGCVYIDLPTGQISYHFHDREAALFADLPPYTKAWDGHDKDAVHARLAGLAHWRAVKT